MTTLSTHVLDLYSGTPASNVTVDFYYYENLKAIYIDTFHTDADGRIKNLTLHGKPLKEGTYELVFHVDYYFKEKGIQLPEPNFLGKIPVRFSMEKTVDHYHVPLLVSPWSYQVYRGS